MKKIVINDNETNSYRQNEDMKGHYKLLSFQVSNSLYNINSNNNQFILTETSTQNTITLENGNYTPNDLSTEIKTQLDTTFTPSIYTVSYSDITGKYGISNGNSDTLKIEFTGLSNPCHNELGFSNSDIVIGTLITSTKPIDLNSIKNIFIQVDEDRNKVYQGQNFFRTSLRVPVNNLFGNLINFTPEHDNEDQSILIEHPTKVLNIQFYDKDLNLLQLFNWSIILLGS